MTTTQDTIELVKCDRCADETNSKIMCQGLGELVCPACYEEAYTNCADCGMLLLRDGRLTYEYDDSLYCSDCYDNLAEQEIEERLYAASNLPQFQSRKKGSTIKSPRIFSAEIECYYPNDAAHRRVFKQVDGSIGITGDGSLNDRGVEFQTPKLKGFNGEREIKNLCRILKDNDFKVDNSTGLHIHLDGKGLFPRNKTMQEPVALKQLWIFYACFESVMLSFLPRSRRTNRFCQPLAKVALLDAIEASRSLASLERQWYKSGDIRYIRESKAHKYHSSRYAGINFHSLFGEKHLEIRYHSGTLNSTKILEWTNLHQTIMDMCAKKELPIAIVKQALSLDTLERRTQFFFKLLGLSDKSQKYFERRQADFTNDAQEGACKVNEA